MIIFDIQNKTLKTPVDSTGKAAYGIAGSTIVFDGDIATITLIRYGSASEPAVIDLRKNPPTLILERDIRAPTGAIQAVTNSKFWVYSKKVTIGANLQDQIYLFDGRTGKSVLMVTLGIGERLSSFDVSPDGSIATVQLFSGSAPTPYDRTIIFDVNSQSELKPIDAATGQSLNGIAGTTGNFQYVGGYAIASRSQYGTNGGMIIVDLNNRPITVTSSDVKLSLALVQNAALSPDGKNIVFAAANQSRRQVVGVYNISTRAIQSVLLPINSEVKTFLFVSATQIKMTLKNGRHYFLNLNTMKISSVLR
jgi:WD40 repeat protein